MKQSYPFKFIYNRTPITVINDVPYFGSEREADQFTEEDILFWTTGGGFERRWRDRGTPNEYRNPVYIDLCRKAAELNLPVMDIACGPGLGILPDIYAMNPTIQALAVDGCPILVEKWNEFINRKAPKTNIKFASFHVADMPIHSSSVDVITSNIGFSSLRYAGTDQMLGIKEAYRVLKPGGHVFAIENEFEDNTVVQKAFDLWGKENWFRENKLSWRERFKKAGFVIEEEKLHLRRIEKDDWQLGEVAASFGLEIAVIFKAFILKKPK